MKTIEQFFDELQQLKQLTLLQVKEALTMEDVCTLTGLSKAYIYRLVCERKIPFYKSNGGGRTYFKKSEIENWLLANRYNSVDEIETAAR